MDMSISSHAASAREQARRTDGRFGEQGHPDPGQVGIGGPADAEPTVLEQVLAVGDECVVPESEHGDGMVGELVVGRTRRGMYATGGPVVPTFTAVPEGADPDAYLDRWGGLASERAAEAYGGMARDSGDPGEPRIVFPTPLRPGTWTDQVVDEFRVSSPGFDQLEGDLAERPDGTTRFAARLADVLPEADLPDVADDPRVVEALGEGPDLSPSQRYMLNVLADPRNDPNGGPGDLAGRLALASSFDPRDAWSWHGVGRTLTRHASRRGIPGGLVADIDYDGEDRPSRFTVGVNHQGLGARIGVDENPAEVERRVHSAGLRGAVAAAELFDADWRSLRDRLDTQMPSWRDSAGRA